MMSNLRRAVLSIFAVFTVTALSASAWGRGLGAGVRQDDGVRRAYHRQTGKLSFLGADPAEPIGVPSAQVEGLTSDERAMAILEVYGPDFGVSDPVRELELMPDRSLAKDRGSVRYQQVYQGVPVLAGELIVNTDSVGNLRSISGEISPDLSISTTSELTGDEAKDIALQAIAKIYGMDETQLRSSEPELWIFDERLLLPSGRPAELVWRLDVEGVERLEVRELVLVNAMRGGISLHFNQIDAARNRLTYTASNGTVLPGTLVCNESDPTCSAGDTHAAAAHVYAGDTYDFYSSFHGRDSINNAGMVIISTVRYSSGYANAFWNGSQMVYGDAYGFPLADDVVGHELTHGVTQYESNLFYYYQSGAINESFSDVWGEFVDQWNGAGDDTPGVKWLMGEDVTGLGAIRNMADPPTIPGDPTAHDPDKITSTYYQTSSGDNGGVHTNSGVNNKAVFLMTDGGTFNSKTVTALGMTKVAKIYYEVQTSLLTSGSDYADLYNSLYQACLNLVGTSGITSGDCQEVRDATDAVEMNLQPVAGYNTDAVLCPSGGTPSNLFADDLESGSGNWTFGSVSGPVRWGYDSSPYGAFSHSGLHYLYAADYPATTLDSYTQMNGTVLLPAGAYLHFYHAYGFEGPAYDGGVVEYSANGGAWTDAGSLFEVNGYDGALSSSNPLGIRSAFLDDSHGYISTRLNLNTLAGQNVRFRWRMGTDSSVYDAGWWLDDVAIYTCDGAAPSFPVYLPLVAQGYAAAAPGITNGDFEAGPTGWTEYSLNGWDLILQSSDLLVPPHSGDWAVWLGGDYDEIAYIQQQVTVPSGSPYLAYWHWIDSEDVCGYDFGGVLVNGSVTDMYDLCVSQNTGGWVKHVVNLSGYVGQSVSLQIRAETDSILISNLWVDDVAFQSSPSLMPAVPAIVEPAQWLSKSAAGVQGHPERKGEDSRRLFPPVQSR